MAQLLTDADIKARRTAARRTAIWLALIAACIFTAFLLTGVLGR